MKYRAIIWDLDGTLLNTIDDLKDSVNFALTTFHFRERSLEEVKASVGNGVERLLSLSLPKGEDTPKFKEILETFKTYYSQNSAVKTKPYKDILGTITQIKKLGIKQAVVSNKFDNAVKELCPKYFGNIFTACIGETSNIRRKPAPDMLLKASAILKINKEEILFVGDSEVDFKTAQNANIPCVSALWGFRTKEELLKYGAKTFASNPKDVLRIILNDTNKK